MVLLKHAVPKKHPVLCVAWIKTHRTKMCDMLNNFFAFLSNILVRYVFIRTAYGTAYFSDTACFSMTALLYNTFKTLPNPKNLHWTISNLMKMAEKLPNR